MESGASGQARRETEEPGEWREPDSHADAVHEAPGGNLPPCDLPAAEQGSPVGASLAIVLFHTRCATSPRRREILQTEALSDFGLIRAHRTFPTLVEKPLKALLRRLGIG